MGKDWIYTPRFLLALTVVAAWCCCACSADATGEPGELKREGRQSWRWPDDIGGRGQFGFGGTNRRTISLSRPAVLDTPVRLGGKHIAKPVPAGFSVFPGTTPPPPRSVLAQKLGSPQPLPPLPPPLAARPSNPAPAAPGPGPAPPVPASIPPTSSAKPSAESKSETTVLDSEISDPASGGTSNKSSVPLLADAGKPGNPYVLLNKEFPPENSIRTAEKERQVFESLKDKDLGGLEPEEVWLADNDLFVVRGFNYKVPYTASPPEDGPIHDYRAPAPRPPPPPEPGTAFYPTNQTVFNFGTGSVDFGSNDPAQMGPSFPYPFLPPPPPHWHEEKEFNNQNQNGLFDPFSFGGNPNSPTGFQPNGPGLPPPSGLNGFPGAPPGAGPNGGNRPEEPPVPPPSSNFTLPDDDEEVPFTPLFAERPVEYYYPTHNTTAEPPGPFGPGVFVPPPVAFFAPRDPNEVINVKIPEKLFRPPFSLPNYYQKQTKQRPAGSPSAATVGIQQQPQDHSNLPPYLTAIQGQQYAPNKNEPTKTTIQLNPRPAVSSSTFRPSQPLPETHLPGSQLLHPLVLKEPSTTPGRIELVQPQLVDPSAEIDAAVTVKPTAPPASPVKVQVYKPVLLDTDFKEVTLPVGSPYPSPPHENPYFTRNPYGYYPDGTPVGVTLQGDTDVNFQHPKPPVNPDSELIDPTLFLQPGLQWDPYNIRSSQRRPSTSPSTSSPNWQQQHHHHHHHRHQDDTPPSSGSEKHANFVSVYRLGGGSYSYNLGS